MRIALIAAAAIFGVIAAYFLVAAFAVPVFAQDADGNFGGPYLMHLQAMDLARGIGAAIISALFAVGAALDR